VAHVVSAPDAAVAPEDLRAFLAARLPDYMVPADFVFHRQLPLTANGKVDRQALPEPGASARPVNRAPFAAPTNEIEEILLQVWKPLLGVQHLGIDDDFFAAGGTSLTGTRLIMRLRSAFTLSIPIACLAEHPTIRRLAHAINQLLVAELVSAPAGAVPASASGDLP
jgi:hypothetical protein